MTIERQSDNLDLQFGANLASFEELAKKIEDLLERTLTREEGKFLVLAGGVLELNRKPLSKAKAGAA